MNIHDIAALCEVSVATVSRVINGNSNVNEKTREKVLRVMQEADFVPNAFAGGIGRNAMKIVGIMCTDVANLYYASTVSLLENNLRLNGFDVLLCCTGTNINDKKEYLASLIQKRVDAVILVGSAYREERDNTYIREAAQQTPLFMINAYVQIPNVFCVFCDEKEAMYNSTRQMADAGFRDILYLHDMDKWAWAGSQKLAGYREGLEDSGIPENPDMIQVVENGILPARDRVASLLSQGAHITGILASEDLLAVGAQKAILEQKKDIPIIGFNNSQFALCCTPLLSSVDNMMDTICPMVVNMLIRLFSGEKISPKVAVSATLVERETFRLQRLNKA